MSEQAWSPEPWSQEMDYVVADVPTGRPGGEVIIHCAPTVARLRGTPPNEGNAARIVSCVNALAGIADPAAFMRAVRVLEAQVELSIREDLRAMSCTDALAALRAAGQPADSEEK